MGIAKKHSLVKIISWISIGRNGIPTHWINIYTLWAEGRYSVCYSYIIINSSPTFISPYIYIYGMKVRVFANGPGDWVSTPGRVIPKTQKIVLDASLLNTQH